MNVIRTDTETQAYCDLCNHNVDAVVHVIGKLYACGMCLDECHRALLPVDENGLGPEGVCLQCATTSATDHISDCVFRPGAKRGVQQFSSQHETFVEETRKLEPEVGYEPPLTIPCPRCDGVLAYTGCNHSSTHAFITCQGACKKAYLV